MERKTLLELIRKIITDETRYLRHYLGKVVDDDDPDKQGKVRAQIPELGWDTDDVAPWIPPRALNALQTPKKDQWIEVYFMRGNRDFSVYMGQATEMENSLPELFEGDIDNQVLFEDAENKEGIRYKREDGLLEIFSAEQAAVLGDILDQHIDDLKTWVDAHSHAVICAAPGTPVQSGPPTLPPPAAPVPDPSPSVPDFLSDKVKLQ